ncbi:unnamed protein product [Heligmosomoides polygyrus]|uniref:Endo/exonuclease/phosphatase domain-containing protein n=1 Tax=Heligmosomoides polygyrus TaxID=6339 RepID=A0A183GDJ4_HELPZ|nr:unnamed protein product [Heligmosomoides polygyrus]
MLTGRSREVTELMKRRRIQVLCLQETRWKGAKAKEIGEGVMLYYNGEDTKRNGVGSCRRVPQGFSSCCPKNKRPHHVTAAGHEGLLDHNVCLRFERDKDDFYLLLEEAIRSVPEDDYLSIAEDMNGHVGSGRRGVERVRGGKGIDLINPDGERILDLAIAHDLAVCSTFFAKRESQKVTYASGGRKTEVDHILVRRPREKTWHHSIDP